MPRFPNYAHRGDSRKQPASEHNSIAETVRRFRATGTSGGGVGQSQLPGTIVIKNVGPHTEQALSVMEITGATTDYSDDTQNFIHNYAFEVDRPSVIESGKFVVLADKVGPDQYGIGYISGSFPAFVVIDDEFHEYCDTADDDQYLRSYGGGAARILFKDTTVDPAVCIVNMDRGFQHGRGKADAAITKGASGVVSVWSSLSGTSIDTTDNITCLAEMGDVTLGDWVHWAWKDNKWEITQAECSG